MLDLLDSAPNPIAKARQGQGQRQAPGPNLAIGGREEVVLEPRTQSWCMGGKERVVAAQDPAPGQGGGDAGSQGLIWPSDGWILPTDEHCTTHVAHGAKTHTESAPSVQEDKMPSYQSGWSVVVMLQDRCEKQDLPNISALLVQYLFSLFNISALHRGPIKDITKNPLAP